MIRDLAALGAVTVAFLGLALRGAITPVSAAVGLALAPVILGLGRGKGGCLSHVVRLGLVFLLPVLAVVGVFDWTNVPYDQVITVLGAVIGLLGVLFGFYVMLGGWRRRNMWQFLAVVPVLILAISAGAGSGLAPETIAFFLVAVVALRIFSQSGAARASGGEGVRRSSAATFQVGSALAGLITLAFATSGLSEERAVAITAGWLAVVVLLEFGIYFVVRGAAGSAGD